MPPLLTARAEAGDEPRRHATLGMDANSLVLPLNEMGKPGTDRDWSAGCDRPVCYFQGGAGHSAHVDGDDRGYVGALYARHSAAIHAYVLRRADRETADEVTAQVFLVAWRRRSSVPEQALPWLYGVARRTLSEHRRGTARRRRLAERLHAVAPRTQPASEMPDTGLSVALSRLPELDREALLLRYWEELEPQQIAAALHCSTPAAAMRLHRARRRLRRELDRELDREAAKPIEGHERRRSRAGTEST